MKIRLFVAPWEFGGEELSRIYPLGLAYLGAALEREGHDVRGINYGDDRWEEIKEDVNLLLKKEKPDIVGLSVLSSNRTSSFKFFKMVKEINPQTVTIAGGVHATLLWNQVLENYPSVDFVVLGEGEQTIIELTKAIRDNASPSQLRKIKGIAFRYNGKVILTEHRDRINDLNSLPIPKHEYFEDQIKKFGVAYMITSRGCPFNCQFCPSKPFWGRTIVRRNAKNIFSEIKYIIQRFPEVKLIYFADDEFIVDNNAVIDLCKMILNENLKVKFECGGGRVTSINEELVIWMKKAGFTAISIGIESGSQRILDNMNKNQTIPQVIRAVNICKKYGLEPQPLLIIGFPGETKKSVNETIKLLKKLKLSGEAGFLFLVPGTGVYEFAKKQKYISDDYWLTENPIPYYFKENSRLKMTFWNLKISLLSNLGKYGPLGIFYFIRGKIIRKLNFPRLRAMLKRHTQKTAKNI